jgi:hypothetical protein
MPKKKEPDSTELMLARSLFRSDKWDPNRDANAPFEWEEMRALYIQKANRLLRTFEKDGLQVSVKTG